VAAKHRKVLVNAFGMALQACQPPVYLLWINAQKHLSRRIKAVKLKQFPLKAAAYTQTKETAPTYVAGSLSPENGIKEDHAYQNSKRKNNPDF
jgi:hypothetical protein